MSKIVYISGKIGDEVLSEATREKFAKAEKWLKAQGYDVFSPSTSLLGKFAKQAAKKYATTFYKEILIYDMMALKRCDAICMLPDWQHSPVSLVEYFYAKAVGIEVIITK